MTQPTECPTCHARLQMPESVMGTLVQCPKCSNQFTASTPPSAASYPITSTPPANRAPAVPDFWDHDLPTDLPGKGKALVAMIFLGLFIVGSVLDLVLSWISYTLFDRIARGLPVDEKTAEAHDGLAAIAGCFTVLVYLIETVTFCIWIYQAYKNLRLLRVHGLAYSPGWAVGVFFIPILNLYRPYQVAQEIYKASDDTVLSDQPLDWRRRPGFSVIGWWWAGTIVQGVIGQIVLRLSLRPDLTVEMQQTLAVASIFDDLVSIVTALLAIAMIKTIQDRQMARLEQLHSSPTGGETF